MKIPIGHKVLNLEELFQISENQKSHQIEVVVDSQIYSELNKQANKDQNLTKDYPKDKKIILDKSQTRAVLIVKLVQLLKLKGMASIQLIDYLLKLLNEDNLIPDQQIDFFELLYMQFESEKVIPNDKERFILNSLPNIELAKAALLSYKCREQFSFFNSVLALSIETAEFPLDYLNEYSLTSRGRNTQGVVQFKNQMLALVNESKKLSTKPELNELQSKFDLVKTLSLHSQLYDRVLQSCISLQNEINSDEASIFQNKKYKELIKIGQIQQEQFCQQILEQYDLTEILTKLKLLSVQRILLLTQAKEQVQDLENKNIFEIYQTELFKVFMISKVVEDQIKNQNNENDKEKETGQIEEKKGNDKKQKKKAQQKTIGFGKGTRILFDYLQELFTECKNENLFIQKLDIFQNKEIQTIIREIGESSNENQRKPKCAKGTRDMSPQKMAIREKAFETIRAIFKKHGASEIDTPVFELKETLTSKYGEESKLIYDLEDQGGELLSLRYDLTVPFARYVAQRGLSSIKRFHIAKVYRRDNPQMNRGRFREFYQCDFDIAGTYGLMIPDADLLSVIIDILQSLDIGSFIIKLNHRKFLDAMIQLAGCEKRKFKAICSSIDKLDKESWATVQDELINMKGLTQEMCSKLEKFVHYKGEPWKMLQQLKDEKVFEGHQEGENTIKEMEILFTYLDSMKILDKISFDFSLARGLDYYTGVIYEAILTDTDRVGSISGGGRYDGLIGMFSGKSIPSVGGSIGIERIFSILEEKAKLKGEIRATETQILVSSLGKNLTAKRMETCSILWKAGIKSETLYVDNPRADKTFSYAFDNGIPLILIIGEQEIQEGIYKVKSLNENKEYCYKLEELVPAVKKLIIQNPILLQKENQNTNQNEKTE